MKRKCKKCKGEGVREDKHGLTMYCPDCNGTGEVEVVGDSVTDVCDKCGGTGFCEMKLGDGCTLGSPCPHQKPLTNDEWRRTCSTEDFASWLMKYFSRDDIVVLWVKHNYPTHETADGLKCADYKEAIRRWLKEKHHESDT